MANKFAKVKLDITKVISVITNWCELYLNEDFSVKPTETKQQIMYTINSGSDEIKLILYKAAGGVYTISPNTGKNPEKSLLIAEELYNHFCSEFVKSPYANGFSMKMIDEDFHILIEMLKEYDDIHIDNFFSQDMEGKPRYDQYRLRSDYNDTVVIKYFKKTKRIQIQGKPLYLFNEITSLICSKEENAEALVEAHIKLCDLSVPKEELDGELLTILGKEFFDYLNVTQKAMLNSALIMSKITVNGLDDYSYILMPALKAYDGFFAKEMEDAGISLEKCKADGTKKRVQYAAIFTTTEDGLDCSMNNGYTSGLTLEQISTFQKMYNTYRKDRNPYMHGTESDATTNIIGSFDIAVEHVNSILAKMKEYYRVLTKN